LGLRVNAPYSFAVGMKGLCRLFSGSRLETRSTTRIESIAATVVPLSQLGVRPLPMTFGRRSVRGRATTLFRLPGADAADRPASGGVACCAGRVGMMRDGHSGRRLWQETHELNGGESDVRCTSIVARATSM
jgi:hypothetical protein